MTPGAGFRPLVGNNPTGITAKDKLVALHTTFREGRLKRAKGAPQNELVHMEVEIPERNITYLYRYTLDLGTLFDPRSLPQNYNHPMGLTMFCLEVDAAIREGTINSPWYTPQPLPTITNRIIYNQLTEEEKYQYRYLNPSWGFRQLLRLHTFLDHHQVRGTLPQFAGNENQPALARAFGTESLSLLYRNLACVPVRFCDPYATSWANILEYKNLWLNLSQRERLETILAGSEWEKYRGQLRLPSLAEAIGTRNLKGLVSTLRELRTPYGERWSEVLAHRSFPFSIRTFAEIGEEITFLNETARISMDNLRQLASKHYGPELKAAFTRLVEIYLSAVEYVKSKRRDDIPSRVYNYLTRQCVLKELRGASMTGYVDVVCLQLDKFQTYDFWKKEIKDGDEYTEIRHIFGHEFTKYILRYFYAWKTINSFLKGEGRPLPRARFGDREIPDDRDARLVDPRPSPEKKTADKQAMIMINQAVEQLPSLPQSIVVLHFVDNLPLEEIATELNIPKEKAEREMRSALKRLKKELSVFAEFRDLDSIPR